LAATFPRPLVLDVADIALAHIAVVLRLFAHGECVTPPLFVLRMIADSGRTHLASLCVAAAILVPLASGRVSFAAGAEVGGAALVWPRTASARGG
jgi:hypothetical protein